VRSGALTSADVKTHAKKTMLMHSYGRWIRKSKATSLGTVSREELRQQCSCCYAVEFEICHEEITKRNGAGGNGKVSETTIAGTITMKRKRNDLLIKGSS